jgi:multiple sugar transport system permease protein
VAASASASPVPYRRWRLFKMGPFEWLSLLALIGISILFLAPLGWMISTSLKDHWDLQGNNWIPQVLTWRNYTDAFSFGMWGRWALNTVILTVSAVISGVFATSLTAYAFARLRWPGRDMVFLFVLATMMLPGVVLLIPQFIVMANLPAFGFQGSRVWTNTFLPLIVPGFMGGSAFHIFLLRQFMKGIPMSLSESAKLDGASELRILWSIVMPLSKPALATIAIFSFQGAWQDFMGPLIYLQSERLYNLQLGLRQFDFAAGGAPAWNWLMAASLVVMLPVLIMFLSFQQYFIEGISVAGSVGK